MPRRRKPVTWLGRVDRVLTVTTRAMLFLTFLLGLALVVTRLLFPGPPPVLRNRGAPDYPQVHDFGYWKIAQYHDGTRYIAVGNRWRPWRSGPLREPPRSQTPRSGLYVRPQSTDPSSSW